MKNISSWLAVLMSRAYWQHQFSMLILTQNFFAALGVLWTCTEATAFFANDELAKRLKAWWPYFLGLGLCYALWQMRPKLSVSSQIDDRDTVVEIRIGDAFQSDGSLIVPINSTFDTNIGEIFKTRSSIQGCLLHYEYEGNVDHLNSDIEKALEKERYESEQITKGAGKSKKYKIGTVISIRPRKRTYYLVATSDLNADGRSKGTVEDVRNSLASLWTYISQKGDKGHVVIPLIGTGKGRIHTPRSEICKEIIRSFVAACSEGTFCDKLDIMLYYRDVRPYQIDLSELGSFLHHACTNTQFREQRKPAIGIGLD